MKKIVLALLALVFVGCDLPERNREVYEVVEKGSNISSHYNPFHKDNFSIGTDYYITFKNVRTGRRYVYKCRDGKEYDGYEKGKRYYCDFIY